MIKNCLILSNMYPSKAMPAYGIFVQNMEKQLVNAGIDVDKVVIQGRGVGIVSKLQKYIGYIVRAIMMLLTRRYDVVYVHYISLSAIPLLFCYTFVRGCIIFNAHGDDLMPSTILDRIMLRLVSPIVDRSDLLVVPSSFFASTARLKLKNVPLFVSPSGGIDRSLFNSAGRKFPSEHSTHIGFVSRIDPGKGWDVLLRAIANLGHDIMQKVQVTIVGTGSCQDEMTKMIAASEYPQRISCLGFLPHSALPTYYRSFDLFVFPTTRDAESLGLVGLEALSCGTPIIASEIGGISEYVKDGENGWIFPPNDDVALASLILAYVESSPEKKAAMQEQCPNSVAHFDAQVVSKNLLERINLVASAHAGGCR